eukprot:gnl/TRDRNA2_/TRDRNA2_146639_c1_seq1.p1 gnl/TRDRNA2_/TRDRNA2_146639_c1~~gnl/TRDRNA2_/TRDRNA2_146639_c1_seq1.p1  ORF type:complete len:306 (-),score=65.38 gnl/TRDRNA2_/TRDRNA2_146639_c1_seq1:85-936(-)
MRDYKAADALQDRGESLGEEDERTVTDLLIDQIEFADVIVLSKVDLVTNEQALEVEAIIKALNPGAKTIRATRGQVPLEKVFDTGLFDYDKASNSAAWIRELQGEHKPETEEYGISSFSYRTPQPFDAEKLWDFINDEENWNGVLRSKGYFWVAPDPRAVYGWSQAGGICSMDPAGRWWTATPREQRADYPDGPPDQKPDWHPRFGDRLQQLVFIGQRMDEARMRARLDACLLDESLANASMETWTHLSNPFPLLDDFEEREEDPYGHQEVHGIDFAETKYAM